MSTASVTGVGTPIKLGDHEFTIHPLTDADISELDEWVQSRVIEIARRSLVKGLTPLEREELLRCAFRTASSMTWLSGDGARIMATVDGLTKLVHQSIKKSHPKVTHADLRMILVNPANAQMFNFMFRKVNGTIVGDDGKKGDPGPQPSKSE